MIGGQRTEACCAPLFGHLNFLTPELMQMRPLLLGHRGVRGEKPIPENSLASFDLALAQGCDGFEFDVRNAADGEAVICHDSNSGGKEISACSAEELSLPSLRDVLSRYQSSAFLDIELKVTGLDKIVASLLREFTPSRGFVVSSFLPAALHALHREDQRLPLGLICETPAQFKVWPELPIEYVIPQYQLLKQEVLAKLKGAAKKILVWTVNSPEDAERFWQWGVDGIISDNPKLLRSSLTTKQND